MAIDGTMGMTEYRDNNKTSTAPIRSGQLSIRKQCIERWAYKGRSVSTDDKVTRSSASVETSLSQKRSESVLFQSARRLNMHLFQLGEQRQKLIEQHNFDQKLFANKQAIRHRDNQTVLRTLNYVRKCCKYDNKNINDEGLIDSTMSLEENGNVKKNRSRSPVIKRNLRLQTNSSSLMETFLKHNEKYIESSRKSIEKDNTSLITHPCEPSCDEETPQRHVQFRINTKRASQSAHVHSKSRSLTDNKQPIRNVSSAHEIRSASSTYESRTMNSAPIITAVNHPEKQMKRSSKIKRPHSRIFSSKSSLQEFRLHPERFLSKSNRYLPLLHRQATDIESHEFYIKQQKEKTDLIKKQRTQLSLSTSRLSVGSDLAYDDAKSFLSEEFEAGKLTSNSHVPVWDYHDRRNTKELHLSSKIDLMERVDDDTSEHTIALARLRDREYAHLHALIRSNSINHILEAFSSVKPSENKQQQSMHLGDIIHSIDSLRCSNTVAKHAPKQLNIEKNLSKLGILIF